MSQTNAASASPLAPAQVAPAQAAPTFAAQLDELAFSSPPLPPTAKRKLHRALRATIIAALGWEPEGPARDGEDYCACTADLARWADADGKAAVR